MTGDKSQRDIIERLRCYPEDEIREAAAEIERLRAALAEETACARETDHALAKAEAEIDRLRAALLTVPCPGGGWNGMPANTEPTVAACLAAGVCGCIYGDALRSADKGNSMPPYGRSKSINT